MANLTRDFFEGVQLGRVTRTARTFAFQSGVYRAMDIANTYDFSNYQFQTETFHPEFPYLQFTVNPIWFAVTISSLGQ